VKRAFSLIEVLVAVMLLTVVIGVVLKVQQNNLFFVEQFKESSKNDEYLSIATLDQNKSKDLRNTHIYLDKVVDFKDDDVRKILKELKVTIKDKELDEVPLSAGDYQIIMKQYESEYKIDGKVNKKFYSFELEY
jgi:prepilin-type N-terminal cleavage/methylation domain-containing protein